MILAASSYGLSHTDDKNAKETFGVISHQAERMSSLVSELLYIARADKGTIKLEKEDIDLSELMDMVAETMEERASEKGISIHTASDDNVIVSADRDMMMRVLINLVSNAITYGRENGNIWVSISRDADNAIITVRDDGIGISEEHINRIWDRFYQVDGSRSAGNGSGLGLSIVKEIATLHNGSVSIESEKGKGSTFRVDIPLQI